MTISESKTRTLITLEKTVKAELEQEAKNQNRSLNNLIETILKDYLAKK
jgi:predicted HicB family RNase H-like nuclease